MEHESELKLFFWIGTTIIVGLMFMVLLLSIVYQKKVHKIKQKEAENLLKVSLESEKRERKRIASDLHDGVLGDLNAIRNYITVLKNEDQDRKITENQLLIEIETAFSITLKNIQGISYNLMPPLLENAGFIPTLRDYFERIMVWNKFKVSAKYPNNDIHIPSSISYELFRIVQELIVNLLKHGKATRVDFKIEEKDNILFINMIDDGLPFDFYENLKTSKGMGLKNIMSRLKQVEASLTQIQNESGNEIIITLKIQ